MRPLAFIVMALIPTLAVADMISISVPSAVLEAVDVYRVECADEGGELELDGDEISKLRTDEGEEAYVIHAAFTCGDLGHLWCGAMGCPTDLVINNKFTAQIGYCRSIPLVSLKHQMGRLPIGCLTDLS